MDKTQEIAQQIDKLLKDNGLALVTEHTIKVIKLDDKREETTKEKA